MSVADHAQQLVTTGNLLLAMPVAATAGFVSFASPCVLPLVPGYLSYVSGVSGQDVEHGGRQLGRVVAGVALSLPGCSSPPSSTRSGGSGPTGSPAGWRARCRLGWCSGLGGRRVSGRRWAPYSAWPRSAVAAWGVARSCCSPTRWALASRS